MDDAGLLVLGFNVTSRASFIFLKNQKVYYKSLKLGLGFINLQMCLKEMTMKKTKKGMEKRFPYIWLCSWYVRTLAAQETQLGAFPTPPCPGQTSEQLNRNLWRWGLDGSKQPGNSSV